MVASWRSKWAAGKARGGRISKLIRNRRATQPPAHFHRNPLGRGQLAVFLRCSLLTYRFIYARHSRLEKQPTDPAAAGRSVSCFMTRRIKPLLLLFFFFGAVFVYALGNSSLPLIDRDEPRFAEASREMWQNNDFLLPKLNGEYRFDKPPLIYWSQVLAYDFLGDNDFAARLPSVIFAALTATATLVFATRVFGVNVGLWAGLIFASCLQMFVHARAAVADMAMLLFFLMATWAAWERLRNSSRFWWWAFYLSLGFGFLAKGPV